MISVCVSKCLAAQMVGVIRSAIQQPEADKIKFILPWADIWKISGTL
jgi:hypothetical protein